MKILSINRENIVTEIKNALEDGQVLILPCDTVYGLFCDAQNQCFYDSRLGKYVAYLRGQHRLSQTSVPGVGGGWGRVVKRTEMDDLLTLPWPHI